MYNSWNIAFWEYTFYAPSRLWLLLLLPVLWWLLFKKNTKNKGNFKFTGTLTEQKQMGQPRIFRFFIFRNLLLLLSYTLLVLALAKPFHFNLADDAQPQYKNGIDIILAMDVSFSMYAQDFTPNRLEAAKKVAIEFVEDRPADRIGLVAFSGEAYGACPLTLDREVLTEQITSLNGEELEQGTAIGVGLGTAVSKLRSDSLVSKVIILLTDGSNNFGDISPETAAELAKAKNICVYTIGVGSNGNAPTPIITPFGIEMQTMPVEIDEVTLSQIARITGGKYFRATDEESLSKIYDDINQLEKRKLLDKNYSTPPKSTPWAFINWSILIVLIIHFINFYFVKTDA